MAIEKVKEYFRQFDRENDILEFAVSSATVELAAEAVGVEPARIAKTLSFYEKDGEHAFLVVTAGDVKIDNKKFKQYFGLKAKMLSCEDAEIELTCDEPERFSNAKEWVDVCKTQ